MSQVGDFSTDVPSRLTSLSIVGSTGSLVKSSEERECSAESSIGATKSTLLTGVTLDEKPCIAVFEVAWKKIPPENQLENPSGSSLMGKGSGKIGGGGGTTKKVLPAPPILNQTNSVGLVSVNDLFFLITYNLITFLLN